MITDHGSDIDFTRTNEFHRVISVRVFSINLGVPLNIILCKIYNSHCMFRIKLLSFDELHQNITVDLLQ